MRIKLSKDRLDSFSKIQRQYIWILLISFILYILCTSIFPVMTSIALKSRFIILPTIILCACCQHIQKVHIDYMSIFLFGLGTTISAIYSNHIMNVTVKSLTIILMFFACSIYFSINRINTIKSFFWILKKVSYFILSVENKEYILKTEVKKVKDEYDFVVIDCPPALSMLTINAMTTADSIIVPIQCEYYALEGLSQLIHTIELVQERLNPNLEIEGVVFTMYDARTNLSLQVVENVKDNLNQNIYKTIIPRNIRLAEAPSYGMPINLYDPKSTGATSYMLLAEEVIHKGEE